jgi:hypothetical protein
LRSTRPGARTGVTKSQEIKTAAGQIERLTAEIQKHEAAAVDLTDKVAALDADTAGWKSDHEKLTEIRDKEHGDYKVTHTDYSESISAIERAIVAIQASSTQKISQEAMMFLQTLAVKARLPAGSKQLITSLLQQTPYAYESSSGGVIEMLEKLKEQFYEERNTLEKEEMNGRHAYDMEALTLTDSIKAAEKESGEKKSALSDHKSMAGAAKGTLEMVSTEKAEDEKYLQDLTSQCRMKAEAFESRQKMRQEEIDAIAEAIGIIKEKVSGLADKHLPSLAQKKVSLSLLRSSASVSHAALKAKAAAPADQGREAWREGAGAARLACGRGPLREGHRHDQGPDREAPGGGRGRGGPQGLVRRRAEGQQAHPRGEDGGGQRAHREG